MELSRKIEITFNWWNNEIKELTDYDIIEQLEAEAETRVREMRNEGYTSGELCAVIDDIEYRGFWEYNYVEPLITF